MLLLVLTNAGSIADSLLLEEQTAALTSNGNRLSEFSMVFYNNLLSLPFLAVLIWAFGEVSIHTLLEECSACSLKLVGAHLMWKDALPHMCH